jgi:hypothetical protein
MRRPAAENAMELMVQHDAAPRAASSPRGIGICGTGGSGKWMVDEHVRGGRRYGAGRGEVQGSRGLLFARVGVIRGGVAVCQVLQGVSRPASMSSEQLRTSKPWIFRAIEMGQSAALGGNLRLELHPRATVLVGKNGAGKSAILEAITKAAYRIYGLGKEPEPEPARFAVEICNPNHPSNVVRYECQWSRSTRMGLEMIDEDAPTMDFVDIEERCSIVGGDVLWSLEDGILQRNDGSTDTIPPGRSLLNWWWTNRNPEFLFNKMVEPIYEMLCLAIASVHANVPRAGLERNVAIIPYGGGSKRYEKRYEYIPSAIRTLMTELANWHEGDKGKFQEFIDVARRLELLEVLEISLSPNPEHAADRRAPRNLLGVSVDGVNIGLLSDGTLRVFQILVALIDPQTKLLLLEEPEIAIHPGLLGRLLEEVDAYSTDRQILLSTQSPQVVSWAKPDSLRLVERVNVATRARGLDEEECSRIAQYLDDQGTLGDYVYAGGLDG